jgi:hypothetical protein
MPSESEKNRAHTSEYQIHQEQTRRALLKSFKNVDKFNAFLTKISYLFIK